MALALTALVAGIGLLAFASDQFVIGAARVASLRNVPRLVVGVVIVGLGTSAPEMLVSALAVVDGEAGVAVGNVVGSNLANLSLLLGIGAVLVPLVVTSQIVRREAPIVVAATLAFAVAVQGGVERWEGLLLLIGMLGSLVLLTRGLSLRQGQTTDQLVADAAELTCPTGRRLSVETARTVGGLVGTIGSAQLLLLGALRVAEETGLSGGFVGVTLVALGTSLPELVTVVQSARRSETDLIVGNLLGSNLFNALGVGGLIGILGTGLELTDRSLTLAATGGSLGVAVLAFLAMATRHTVSRLEGLGLVTLYAAAVPLLA